MATLLPGQTITAIAATSSATAAPSGATSPIGLTHCDTARTFCNYAGQVDTCVIKLWTQDDAGTWYEGPSTEDLDALTPGGASAVDESRDWIVGDGSLLAFQVVSITGGGSVTVRVQGVTS